MQLLSNKSSLQLIITGSSQKTTTGPDAEKNHDHVGGASQGYTTPTLTAHEACRKRRWEGCKSKRTRRSAVRLSPRDVREATAVIPQQYAYLNKI